MLNIGIAKVSYSIRNCTTRIYSTSGVLKKAKDNSSSTYCLDLVRKHDYEMFLCTLLISDPEIRTKVMAVRAFNTEIALIRDQVSQKETGLMRLAFWRDAINQLYQVQKNPTTPELKSVPRHPAVLELTRVIQDKNISQKWFTNLLDGRERMMSDAPFLDLTDLELYTDQTTTSIFYITFEMIGVKNLDVDHAASHLGKAIGIATFIRSIPHNSHRRRVLFPQQLLTKYGLSQEDLIRNKNSEKIKELVFEVASLAHSHYEKAKSMKKSVEKQALPIFLAGVPSYIYLKRLQQAKFDPFDKSLTRRYGLLPWHLYYKKLTKVYY